MKKLILILVLVGLIGVGIFSYKSFSDNSKNINSENIIDKKIVNEEVIIKKKDLFEDYYDEALNMMETMSLEEKIGQLFLVRYDKYSAISEINNYYTGGYLLFAKDFNNHTKESISSEISNLQNNSKYPLIIAVDEEGGYVTRVSRYSNFRSEMFFAPKYYYELGGYELLSQIEDEKAKLLLSLGINLNLAPVADISVNPSDFIYNRSFGMDAASTATFISNMVGYANNAGISSSLKHFPGYGNNVDTHTGIAIDNRSYEDFINNDFLPFKSGIENKVPTILVSHNIINCIDNSYPASLSEKVISELRNTLDFSGIVMTDDLAMDAVKSYVVDGKAATLAINAGNDLIITSDFVNMYNEVLTAVNNGEISLEKINNSVRRILAWKIAYNM